MVWASCYDDRPGKLFDGLEHIRATVVLSRQAHNQLAEIRTTNLLRWYSDFRDGLFPLLSYGDVLNLCISGNFPKIGEPELNRIVQKMRRTSNTLEQAHQPGSPNAVYYYRSPLYWIRSMDFRTLTQRQRKRFMHHFADFGLVNRRFAPLSAVVINSTIFYIWFISYGNGRNVALRDILSFPAPSSLFEDNNQAEFRTLFARLMGDYRKHSVVRKRNDGVEHQEFYPSKSKPILDEISIACWRGTTASVNGGGIGFHPKLRYKPIFPK